MRRALVTVAYAAALMVSVTSPAWARVYDRIQKPWSPSALLELVVLTAGVGVLARAQRARWAGVALLASAGWGVLRVVLDPMFDPLIGVMMRRHEVSLGTRMVYLAALFASAVTPVAVAMILSAGRGHFVWRRWRTAFIPAYAVACAVLVVVPEFMELRYFPQ
jgi:hypothetical protein